MDLSSLNSSLILAGVFLVLALIFTFILIDSMRKNKGPRKVDREAFEREYERAEQSAVNDAAVKPAAAPPSTDNRARQWVLLSRLQENAPLTVSLPGKEIVRKGANLTEADAAQLRSFAAGFTQWMEKNLPEAAKESRTEVPVLRTGDKEKSHPLTRSLFDRNPVREISPLVPIPVQINAILQDILEEEKYEGPMVYLTDNLEGDLVIVIGRERYVGVESVPNPEIAAFIKRAGEQWTNRNLAGE
jgi:hypothetical protein